MFVRYALRTLDVEAARVFYTEVAGLDFSVAPDVSGIEAWPLHEQARARGAPAHWLGQLATPDVEATAMGMVSLGADRLGPTQRGPDGDTFATLRDPLGSIVGLRSSTKAARRLRTRPAVVWHHLHTRELERAWSVYGELFEWHHTSTVEAAGLEGGIWTFSCDRGDPDVGSIANSARAAGVHPHWLYAFPVDDLDASLRLVRAKGGTVLEPVVLPNGLRMAPCDDPQGAAFGLVSSS